MRWGEIYASEANSKPNWTQPEPELARHVRGDFIPAATEQVAAEENRLPGRTVEGETTQLPTAPKQAKTDLQQREFSGEVLDPEKEAKPSVPMTHVLESPVHDSLSPADIDALKKGQAENYQPRIPQKDIIFETDRKVRPDDRLEQQSNAPQFHSKENIESRKLINQIASKYANLPDEGELRLRAGGKPFGSEKSLRVSKGFRDAQKLGMTPEVVKTEGGFGWKVSGKVDPEKIQEDFSRLKPEQIRDLVAEYESGAINERQLVEQLDEVKDERKDFHADRAEGRGNAEAVRGPDSRGHERVADNPGSGNAVGSGARDKPGNLDSQGEQSEIATAEAVEKTPSNEGVVVSEAKEKSAAISDFGETLLGARKHVWQRNQERLSRELSSDAAKVKLSEVFPALDY